MVDAPYASEGRIVLLSLDRHGEIAAIKAEASRLTSRGSPRINDGTPTTSYGLHINQFISAG
jgi:hypothetical protein